MIKRNMQTMAVLHRQDSAKDTCGFLDHKFTIRPQDAAIKVPRCNHASFSLPQVAVAFVEGFHMRSLLSRGTWIALLFAAAVAGLLWGNRGDTEADRLATLIRQLGDDSFVRREAARKELATLGKTALPALIDAANTSTDEEIRQRAQELVSTLLPASYKSKSLGLSLVRINVGEFLMGSPEAEPNRQLDEAQHKVRITRPFYLGKYEVTQDEYERIMPANPSWFCSTGTGKERVRGQVTGKFPVESITWFDAVQFCNQLSNKDGLEAYYKLANVQSESGTIYNATVTIAGGPGYRLPTEAEWEYACRAGSNQPFCFGSENTGREANVKAVIVGGGYGAGPKWNDLGRTTTVGSYAPSRWGLYDMHGNVAEWCWDWYDRDYYAHAKAANPQGPSSGQHRVVRGGSWLVTEGSCRSASRSWRLPSDHNYYIGFRIAKNF
jgi:formylglycine-generating enzyme required for sulfatase activity